MAYPKKRKIALVKEYAQGKTVAEISKDSGIPENSIYRWIREYQTLGTEINHFTPNDYMKLQKHSVKADHVLGIIRLSGYISLVPLKKGWKQLKEFIIHSHSIVSTKFVRHLKLTGGRFITIYSGGKIQAGVMKKNPS